MNTDTLVSLHRATTQIIADMVPLQDPQTLRRQEVLLANASLAQAISALATVQRDLIASILAGGE
jgi:hypothetical protein